MLDVVLASISIACPADDTHSNMNDSVVEPDMIAVMPPPAEVSTLHAAHPISKTVLGQSPTQHEPTEPAVAPPTASPGGHVPASRESKLRQLKAERLAWQAQQHL